MDPRKQVSSECREMWWASGRGELSVNAPMRVSFGCQDILIFIPNYILGRGAQQRTETCNEWVLNDSKGPTRGLPELTHGKEAIKKGKNTKGRTSDTS